MSFIKISETEHINPNTNEKVKCLSVTTDDNQKYLIINTREELDNLREELASEQAVLDSLGLNNLNGQDVVQLNNIPLWNTNNAYKYYTQSNWWEAIRIYDKLWNTITFSYQDIIGYANSCRNIKKSDKALKALEVYQVAITQNPNFNNWEDYHWSKYYAFIKVYPDNINSETKIRVATEIKEYSINLPNKKYTPYFKTCLYMAKWSINKGKEADAIQWLKGISYKELSTDYKFKKNGETIYMIPERANYFSHLCEAYYKTGNLEKAISYCFTGLNEYKNLYDLKTILTDTFTLKHQLQTELFDTLLASVGFQNGGIRDNYLKANIGEEVISNWEYSLSNSDDFHKSKIGGLIHQILSEIITKKSDWVYKEFERGTFSSSEVGSYVFCPVSYAINKSIEPETTPGSLSYDFSEKQNISQYFGTNGKVEKLEELFTFLDKHEVSLGESDHSYLSLILSSRLLGTDNIHISQNGKHRAAPDNEFTDNGDFIVEEKYRNQGSVDSVFTSHRMELAHTVIKIEKLNNHRAYIIYWIGKFENDRGFKLDYKPKDIDIFEINITDRDKENLEIILAKMRELMDNSVITFDKQNINAKKCARCSVSQYCYHKTGKYNELHLPYKKYEDVSTDFVVEDIESNAQPNIQETYGVNYISVDDLFD